MPFNPNFPPVHSCKHSMHHGDIDPLVGRCLSIRLKYHNFQSLSNKKLNLMNYWEGWRGAAVVSIAASLQEGHGFNSVPGPFCVEFVWMSIYVIYVWMCKCLFISLCRPCDELAICPGCTLPLPWNSWDGQHPCDPECRIISADAKWMELLGGRILQVMCDV